MSKSPTKAQLAAELELARAEISRLKVQLEAERDMLKRERMARDSMEQEIAALRKQVEVQRTEIKNVTEVASSLNTMKRERPAYVQPDWQVARKAAMEEARRNAVELGRCVLVTSH